MATQKTTNGSLKEQLTYLKLDEKDQSVPWAVDTCPNCGCNIKLHCPSGHCENTHCKENPNVKSTLCEAA